MKTIRCRAVLGLIAALGAAGCGFADEPSLRRNLVQVRRADLPVAVEARGTLVARRSVDLSAPVSNDPHYFKIARLAPEGVQVRAGDILMELDTRSIVADIREFQAEISQLEEELSKKRSAFDLQLSAMRVEIESARVGSEKARLRADVDPLLVSERQSREDRLEVEQSEKTLSSLQAKWSALDRTAQAELDRIGQALTKTRRRLDEAHRLKKKCSVRSPISGTVVYQARHDGEKRKVGDQICHHQTAVQIPDLSSLTLRAVVDEVESGQIEEGQSVEVRIDVRPHAPLTGHVLSVGRVLRRSQKGPLKVADVLIGISKTEGLHAGMTARGVIEVARRENVLLVPTRLIDDSRGQMSVWMRSPSGKVRRQIVELGLRGGDWVEVTAGLAEGDRLMDGAPSKSLEALGAGPRAETGARSQGGRR